MYRVFGCCALLILALTAQVVKAEDESYTMNAGEDDNVVVITDDAGNVVSTIINFPDEGFEVALPADSNECLIKDIEDASECYEDLPVTEPLPSEVTAACAGRVVRAMSPTDCESAGGPVGERKKRQAQSECCRYTPQVNSICSSTYCCKKFLGICTKKCCNYTTNVTYVFRCVYGYENL